MRAACSCWWRLWVVPGGRSDVERKYDVFEKAIFGTIQKADESNDSYLARHDVHFEELLSQSVTLEEVRAYVLLRQSALSAEDRKKIVVENEWSP